MIMKKSFGIKILVGFVLIGFIREIVTCRSIHDVIIVIVMGIGIIASIWGAILLSQKEKELEALEDPKLTKKKNMLDWLTLFGLAFIENVLLFNVETVYIIA
jgi:hypothetical protein